MTLGDKQRLFSRLVAKLILHAYKQGYAITLGAALRTGDGERLHARKLAMDLNLFTRDARTGQWVYRRSTEAHRELGEWWEKQHELCCWGGRFNDGNHYSIGHNGMR
jgi:hypothetical protein